MVILGHNFRIKRIKAEQDYIVADLHLQYERQVDGDFTPSHLPPNPNPIPAIITKTTPQYEVTLHDTWRNEK